LASSSAPSEGSYDSGYAPSHLHPHHHGHRDSACSTASGGGGGGASNGMVLANPDLQSGVPLVMQLLDGGHSGQQQLLQLWAAKRAKLEQCLQLRLFEQDCEKARRISYCLHLFK